MKAGFLTSEFAALVGSLVVAVVPVLQGNSNPTISIGGMLLAAFYGAFRTYLKSLPQPTAAVTTVEVIKPVLPEVK